MKDIDNDVAVSKYTGLGVTSIRNSRCGNGTVDIPYMKLGKSVRYRKVDVDAWMASRTVTPTSDKAA